MAEISSYNNSELSVFDPEINNLIALEKSRQSDHLELIASENYASIAVMQAQGSILTNKYAEGYPGRRYYGGCEYVDEIETLAIDRAMQLFNAPYANVQPHSGSQANQAVFFATLTPNDTVLGLSLSCGGHLTHGASVNLSGKLFNFIHYGLDKDELIDYDQVATLAYQHKPKMIIAGASAYSRTIDFKKFREIADAVGSYLMVDMAHYAGLIAAKLYPNPMPYADFVTSTTHKTLRGPRGGLILAQEQYAKLLNSSIFPSLQGGPLEHVIAAKAVAFKEALLPEFTVYQKQVIANAQIMAATFMEHNIHVISGGTDSHLMLLDISRTGISGKVAQELLDSVNITTNKNSIPNDQTPPTITSGIRIGTPAITTRGFTQNECRDTALMIIKMLKNPTDQQVAASVKQQVVLLCKQFPVYR